MEGWEACLENTQQPWGRWGWQEQTREAGNARSDLEPGKSLLKSLFNNIRSPGWDCSPWLWLLCWRYLKSWCWHDVLGDLPPSSWQSGSSPKKITIALLSTASCRVFLALWVDCSPLGPRCWAFEIWKLRLPSPVCHVWSQMSWNYVIINRDSHKNDLFEDQGHLHIVNISHEEETRQRKQRQERRPRRCPGFHSGWRRCGRGWWTSCGELRGVQSEVLMLSPIEYQNHWTCLSGISGKTRKAQRIEVARATRPEESNTVARRLKS